jgi:arylsulfatase A-like enzyme
MNVDTVTLVNTLVLAAILVALAAVIDRRWAHAAVAPGDGRARRSRRTQPLVILVIAVSFGLGTGLVHLCLAFINRYVRGHFLMVGPQALWMVPLAYALFFVTLGLVLGLLRIVSVRLVPLQFMVALFAGLGLFSLLLPYPQLHRLSSAALAAGFGVQLSRIIVRQPERWLKLLPSVTVTAAIVLCLVASGQQVWRATAEAVALRRLTAGRPEAPNVLFVVLDTVRASSLSLYGYGRPTTPELERWAAEGTTFDLAFSTSPWTLKSHATMFTGLYPSQIEGDFEHPVNPDVPTLAEIFRDQGYLTAGFVANLLYTSRESGLARGFLHYEDYKTALRQVPMHSWIAHTPLFQRLIHSRSLTDLLDALRHPVLEFKSDGFNNRTYGTKPAASITTSFLDWQAGQTSHPFFAFLNYFDAHGPYRAPPTIAARFALAENQTLGYYDGAIAFIDQEIGRLFDELRTRGVLDKTIVIVTSDHGEQFGEHGLTEHANSLYLPLLHVPLMIRYPPAVARNVRVARPVTLRDLAATVIDLAGLAPHGQIAGAPFGIRLNGGETGRSASANVAQVERAVRPEPNTPVRFGAMQALIDARFHYIRRGDGLEELYAYTADADETRNLSDTPDGQREMARLRPVLAGIPRR